MTRWSRVCLAAGAPLLRLFPRSPTHAVPSASLFSKSAVTNALAGVSNPEQVTIFEKEFRNGNFALPTRHFNGGGKGGLPVDTIHMVHLVRCSGRDLGCGDTFDREASIGGEDADVRVFRIVAVLASGAAAWLMFADYVFPAASPCSPVVLFRQLPRQRSRECPRPNGKTRRRARCSGGNKSPRRHWISRNPNSPEESSRTTVPIGEPSWCFTCPCSSRT